MENLKAFFTLVLCVSSVISCLLWVRSATVKAPYKPKQDESGMWEMSISVKTDKGHFDVLETAELQTKWNKWAAGFAAIAAVSQAILSYIPAQ
jgi:hypothetical protein